MANAGGFFIFGPTLERSYLKIYTRIVAFTVLVLLTASAFAQDYAKDTLRISATYNRTDFPYATAGLQYSYVENVNGFSAEADYKVYRKSGFRLSAAYNFKQMNHVNVYPLYYDHLQRMVFDLRRNVRTHSAGGQLGYTIKGAVEPFAGLFYGTRKLHTDTPRQAVQTFRVGVNIPFHRKSRFFIKGHLDNDRTYGAVLPMGFIDPACRTLSIGGGFRF